jgi:hypothetical protein
MNIHGKTMGANLCLIKNRVTKTYFAVKDISVYYFQPWHYMKVTDNFYPRQLSFRDKSFQ